MKKHGASRLAFVFAGIAVAIAIAVTAEANQLQSAGSGAGNGEVWSSTDLHGDSLLSEYFDSEEDANPREAVGHSAIPKKPPVVYVQQSIWKNLNGKTTAGKKGRRNPGAEPRPDASGLLPALRRLFGYQDHIDDNGSIDDIDANPFGYTNYHKEEIWEHDEKLITDDDSNDNEYSEDASKDEFEDYFWAMDTGKNNEWPTLSPTPLDSSFWDGLDAYEEHSYDGLDSGDEDSGDEDSGDEDSEDVDSEDNEDGDNDEFTDTDILLERPPNSIVLRVALGVVHFASMSDENTMDAVGMALRTITEVLNDHAEVPFVFFDHLEAYDEKHRDYDDDDEDDRKRRRNQVQNNNNNKGRVEDRFENVDALFKDYDEEDPYLAKIFLENVKVEEGDDYGWWTVSAIYSVWKNPPLRQGFSRGDDEMVFDGDKAKQEFEAKQEYVQNGNKGHRELRVDERPEDQPRRRQGEITPVRSRVILHRIEGICHHALKDAVHEDVYWETFETIQYGNHELVLDPDIYFADEFGVVDAAMVGEEYDLFDNYCPMDRPLFGPGAECPKEVKDKVTYHDRIDDDVPPMIPVSMKDLEEDCCSGTYPDVIAYSVKDVEWDAREWVGVALMISAIVWTVGLSVTAHCVFRKRQQKVLWGAALTPTGVDDILQVGWRVYEEPSPLQQQQQQQQPPLPTESAVPGDDDYHQQQRRQQQQQQLQQLFLQIYDKGKGQGYNDENSMLQGGVVQQPPPVNTTAVNGSNRPP